MKVVGDKASFAIEYQVNKTKPYLLGHICIWLNNNFIGYPPEEVMLDCSLGSLIELISKDRQIRLLQANLPTLPDEKLFELLVNDDGDIKDNSMFNIDESTDDFIIHVYRSEDRLKFLWQLCSEPCRDIENYPSGLLSADIEIDHLERVINEFDREINQFKNIGATH